MTAPKAKPKRRPCYWRYDDDTSAYDTTCGHLFQFAAEDLTESGFRYCPYCGREVKEPKR